MLSIYTSECFQIDPNTHYISWALESGLGFAFYQTMSCLNLDMRRTMDIFIRINAAGETVSLYPSANITLMPEGEYDDKTTYRLFNAALRAQNLQIKADVVIFDMRNYCYDVVHGNAEYLHMIKQAYDCMEIFCKNGSKEDWIVLCSPKEKLPSWATPYLRQL